jgi:hypothetical protein
MSSSCLHALSWISISSSFSHAVQSAANAAEALSRTRVPQRIPVLTASARDNPGTNDDDVGCTTRSDKTHITETHVVHYRWHPWYGRTVYVFKEIDKNNSTFFRCALEPARTARPLEVPKWMFDTAACARCSLQDSPTVPWDTLRQLLELLKAAARSDDLTVVQDGHLDRLNPGGAHATPESPAGRSAQSVSSGSDHSTMGAIAARDATEDAHSARTITQSSSAGTTGRRIRRGGAR